IRGHRSHIASRRRPEKRNLLCLGACTVGGRPSSKIETGTISSYCLAIARPCIRLPDAADASCCCWVWQLRKSLLPRQLHRICSPRANNCTCSKGQKQHCPSLKKR